MAVTLDDHSEEILKQMNKKAELAMKAVGIRVEKYAKASAPVDTGRLRNSITYDSDDQQAVIGTNVVYAAACEFGIEGTKRKPHHYLLPAVQDHVDEIKGIIKNFLNG